MKAVDEPKRTRSGATPSRQAASDAEMDRLLEEQEEVKEFQRIMERVRIPMTRREVADMLHVPEASIDLLEETTLASDVATEISRIARAADRREGRLKPYANGNGWDGRFVMLASLAFHAYMQNLRWTLTQQDRKTTAEPGPAVAASFAERLAWYREQKGWSQSELARQSGIAQSHISQMEKGTNEPRLTSVIKLADALSIERCDLIPRRN